MLDIFSSDAFSFTTLTESINKIPYAPTMLGRAGLFQAQGIDTLTVAIEMKNNVLTLVPTAARGAPGVNKSAPNRNVRDFRVVHLPQEVHVHADEVQGKRAFGSETEREMVDAKVNEKLAIARLDLDVTHEWQRVGVLKGEILDADGSTVIYNYFTEFGVSQQTIDMNLDSDATKVRGKCQAISRAIEDELGGLMNDGYEVYCGSAFFDAFIDHPAVRDTFEGIDRRNLRDELRAGNDQLRGGLVFGEGIWREYRGKIGGTSFIGTNDAYAVPRGVPGLFKSYFAPAPYAETVNTLGLPFYAKAEPMKYGAGVTVQVQSNPLHICTRPRAIIKLTLT